MNVHISWRLVSFEVMAALALVLGFTATASAATAVIPEFDAGNFSNPTVIDNPWFSTPVGLELEYEAETEDGTETTEIEITGDTKMVLGIETLVYHDSVFLDGELIEDTLDYIAQDDDGNVWYFGEDVDNYEDGVITDNDGAWLAGVDGAVPGYWMLADPRVGDYYKQEYLEGEAEDEATVLSLTETVTTVMGTYTSCLKTKDVNPLDPEGVIEYKYYCKETSTMTVEEKPSDGEREELVEIEHGEDGDDMDDDEDEDRLGDDESRDLHALQVRLLALLQQLFALLQGR